MAQFRTIAAAVVSLALVDPEAALGSAATARDGSSGAVASPGPVASATDAAQGFVLQGVRIASPSGPCAGIRYEMVARGRLIGCTHGPDLAPAGVDILARQTPAELRARTAPTPPGVATTPCIGNGTSGRRVQAIYAYQQGKPNHGGAVVPLIRTWAGEINATYDASAAETAGSRQVPFLTNAQCVLTVTTVALPAAALGANFAATVNALHQKGFNKATRKYLVWADVNKFCGIGQLFPDDTPGPGNENNQTSDNPFARGMTARIDNGCWGFGSSDGDPIEAHELTHTMGSVQDNAPRHSENGHCTDEWDAMCYHDAPGTTMKFTCPATHELLLDCGHNDYFSTAPPAGSYLKTHWNSADNIFQVKDRPPANDRFVQALPLEAGPGTYVGSTLRATREAGEPALPGVTAAGTHSVWYRMLAPSASFLSVDTQGSSFNTVLGVYTGDAVDSLALADSNDDATEGVTYSRLSVPTTAGTTYWIRVDGRAGKRGMVMLHGGFGDAVPIIESVSPLMAKPGTTRITITGQHLAEFDQDFFVLVDGFQVTAYGFGPDETTMSFKVMANSPDPDTVHYTPGMTGPVVLINEHGVAVSEQLVKLTA